MPLQRRTVLRRLKACQRLRMLRPPSMSRWMRRQRQTKPPNKRHNSVIKKGYGSRSHALFIFYKSSLTCLTLLIQIG